MMNPFSRLGCTSNFPVLDSVTKVKEKRMPAYDQGLYFYKLGFGVNLIKVRVLNYLLNIRLNYPSSSLVCKIINKFKLIGPRGIHYLLYFQATLELKSLPKDLLKVLDYLYSEAYVIHIALRRLRITILSTYLNYFIIRRDRVVLGCHCF
ncbi:hypothetical protein V8F44DRAFT_662562 [Aspergillus fumigatus]